MGRLFFLVAGVVCASCLDATQITVHITTNYDCGDTNTGILVGGAQVVTEAGTFTAVKETCLSKDEVGSMVVVPSGSTEEIYLRVLAGVDGTKADACLAANIPAGSNCIEARRILRFVPHRKLELPVALDRSCINIRCAERETCDKGKCANAVVTDPSCIADPSTCPDAGPPTTPDAGVIVDSGVDSGRTLVKAKLLAAGFDQACAVRASDDAVICWGAAMPAVVQLPVKLTSIKYLAIGSQHACASDGSTVTCWGSNTKNQTGGNQPVYLGQGTAVGGLIAGETFTCILDVTKPTHMTRCWGAVLMDSMRPNETLSYQLGQAITGDQNFDAIAAGAHHICGYTGPNGTNTTLFCWGDNLVHQSNSSSATTYFGKPNAVTNLPTTLLGAGFDHSGAGGPTPDNMGNRTFSWGTYPALQLPTVPSEIVFGAQMACTREGGAVRCAGTNGQLMTVPFPSSPPTSIAAGRTFVCELGATADVWCNGTIAAYPSSSTPYEIVLP